MSGFGRRAAELVKEVALADADTLPPFADGLLTAVKEEAGEHYRALLAALGALDHSAGAAQPQADVAAVVVRPGSPGVALPPRGVSRPPSSPPARQVHKRALLRNKRLMLAYMRVGDTRLRTERRAAVPLSRSLPSLCSHPSSALTPPWSRQERAAEPGEGAAVDRWRRAAGGADGVHVPSRACLLQAVQPTAGRLHGAPGRGAQPHAGAERRVDGGSGRRAGSRLSRDRRSRLRAPRTRRLRSSTSWRCGWWRATTARCSRGTGSCS